MADKTDETLYTVTVAPEKAGIRLDRLLADALANLSRTRLRALMEGGHVGSGVDGNLTVETDPARKVRPGETFQVRVPPSVSATPVAQDIALDVAYEDDQVIVVNKPRGLVVHPAPGNPDRTLVNALLAHCGDSLSGIGGVLRPGIVHRLDKDTSGLMIVAKTDVAHKSLSDQLKDRSLSRIYRALVWGVPSPAEGAVEGAIGRNPRNRKKMAVVRRGGKLARTYYRVITSYRGQVSLVECRLDTGRTHQIRVHMASIGHPVVGDPVYGGRPRNRPGRGNISFNEKQLGELHGIKTQLLHAGILEFTHPTSGKNIKLQSEIPIYFNEIIKKLI